MGRRKASRNPRSYRLRIQLLKTKDFKGGLIREWRRLRRAAHRSVILPATAVVSI